MKKYISFILLAITPAWLFAEPVDSVDAKQIASAFMYNLSEQSGAKSGVSTNYQCQKNGNIYILNGTDGGWVLISADDRVRPILAYSPDGEFSIDNVAPATKAWFDNYNEQITIAQKTEIQSDGSISKEWEQLRSGEIRKGTAESVVGPLVETQWNQSPYYNNYCPEINGEKAVTGCVAAAMAQVMSYWQWPKQGIGIHEYKSQNCGTVASFFGGTKYDWDNMQKQLDDGSSEISVNAVAILMRDCGVAVDMDYGIDGSSITDLGKVKDGMVKYFKYSPNMALECKDNYTDDEWSSKLKKELNNGPILYYGFGEGGGHAFICDGYDANDYFHINWGWNGLCDAYYYINDLTPPVNGIGSNENGTYSSNQQAYFGVEPLRETKVYDLQVYENSLLSYDSTGIQTNTLWLGTDAYYRAKIANFGDNEFVGSFAVAVFDKDYRLVSLSNEVHFDLLPNECTANEQEFKVEGTFNYAPDNKYIAAVVYRDDQTDDWTIVSDNSSLSSVFVFDVNYSQVIAIGSKITVYDNFKQEEVTTQEFIAGDEYTCTVSIINNWDQNYEGAFLLSLVNAKGEFIQKIGIVELEQPLEPNETVNIMFRDTIKVDPGSYMLNVTFLDSGDWIVAGAVNGSSNPIIFDVITEYPIDEYEDNNTIDNAYVFPLEFSNDRAEVLTFDGVHFATLHKYGDVDYYKFDLTLGYDYSIIATLYNNNDGGAQTTVEDATIEYSYDGIDWFTGHDYEYRCSKNFSNSERYDELTVNGSGIVYVKIYHPWGKKGTYIFSATVGRTLIENQGGENPGTAVTETSIKDVNIYAHGRTIVVENATDEIRVYDAMGRLVGRDDVHIVSTIKINNPGIYIVKTSNVVKRVMVN